MFMVASKEIVFLVSVTNITCYWRNFSPKKLRRVHPMGLDASWTWPKKTFKKPTYKNPLHNSQNSNLSILAARSIWLPNLVFLNWSKHLIYGQIRKYNDNAWMKIRMLNLDNFIENMLLKLKELNKLSPTNLCYNNDILVWNEMKVQQSYNQKQVWNTKSNMIRMWCIKQWCHRVYIEFHIWTQNQSYTKKYKITDQLRRPR